MAAAYSVATSWSVAGDDHIKNSISAAEKAIALDPSLALPYAVLQNNLTKFIPVNFEKAFEYSNKALSLDPKNTTALLWRGINELALGYFDQADARFKKCLEIDPAYQNCKRYLALSKIYAGKTQEAFVLYDEVMAAGATSIIETFQRTLPVNGNHQAGLYLGLLNKNGFKDRHYPNVFYRRWTDPNFDFEKELALFLTQKQVDTGR